jgi:hypothetical protein
MHNLLEHTMRPSEGPLSTMPTASAELSYQFSLQLTSQSFVRHPPLQRSDIVERDGAAYVKITLDPDQGQCRRMGWLIDTPLHPSPVEPNCTRTTGSPNA